MSKLPKKIYDSISQQKCLKMHILHTVTVFLLKPNSFFVIESVKTIVGSEWKCTLCSNEKNRTLLKNSLLIRASKWTMNVCDFCTLSSVSQIINSAVWSTGEQFNCSLCSQLNYPPVTSHCFVNYPWRILSGEFQGSFQDILQSCWLFAPNELDTLWSQKKVKSFSSTKWSLLAWKKSLFPHKVWQCGHCLGEKQLTPLQKVSFWSMEYIRYCSQGAKHHSRAQTLLLSNNTCNIFPR